METGATRPSRGPLDAEYPRSVVETAAQLDRVQKMLPLLPEEFVRVVQAQSKDFLYGVATTVQAMHDLIGNDALDHASQLLQGEEENLVAARISKAIIGTFGLMEAMGLVACQELVRRDG